MSASYCRAALLLLVTFLLEGGQSGECPQNVLSSASRCLPHQMENGLINNLTAILMHCQQDMLERSLACLKDIDTSCRDSAEKQKLLHGYLDLNRWKSGWDTLCTKSQMLQEHYWCWTVTSLWSAQCIKAHMQTLNQGMRKAIDGWSSRSSQPSQSPSSSSGERVVALDKLKVICQTSKGILGCFQPKLQLVCDPEVSRVFEEMYLASQPPFCDADFTEVSEDEERCPNFGVPIATSSNKLMTNSFVLLSIAWVYCHR